MNLSLTGTPEFNETQTAREMYHSVGKCGTKALGLLKVAAEIFDLTTVYSFSHY